MAVLTDTERRDVWKRHMSYQSDIFATYGSLSKYDLLTYVGDIDQWIDSGSKTKLENVGSEPAKSVLTMAQKEDIETWVTRKRIGDI